MNRFLLTAAIVAALAVPAGIWLGGRLRVERRQEQRDFELRVERKLDEPISLAEIAGGDRTVGNILRHIARQVDVPMVYNRAALDGVVFDKKQTHLPQTPLSLRNVLEMLSQQVSIGYYVDNRRLVITSSGDAEGRLTTRVYPLPQLAGPEQPFGTDLDTWIEVLSVVIEPDSWDSRGGAGEIIPVPGALVIRQTQRVHPRLQQFFRGLENGSPTPDVQADYLASFSPAERRIHAALEVPCDFQCTATPLDEAHHLPPAAVGRGGHRAQIAADAQDGRRLPPRDPAVVARPGGADVLQVTTPEDAGSDLRPVVYDVRDLVKEGVGEGSPDFDSLEELISATVEPDSWWEGNNDGFEELLPGWLVFSQTDEVHAGTANLLTRLRSALGCRSSGKPAAEEQQTPAEQKIAAALEREIKLDYRGLGLQDAVADLAEQTGVNIRLDGKRIVEGSLHIDAPVICELPPLPLKTALRRLLDCTPLVEGELAWIVRDESLVLTTRVDANSQHELLLMDVRGLTRPEEDENSFKEENLVDVVEIMIQPRNWSGAASLSSFRSLLVSSAPSKVNEKVQRLVEGLRQFRDESLLARRKGIADYPTLLIDDEQNLPRDELLLRIYPADDLLGADGLAALEVLQDVITGVVAQDKWLEVGGPGAIIAVPPAGLLVSQTPTGHQQVQMFLDELRQHVMPERPAPPWLANRDKRRQELEQALSSREQILPGVTRMYELRGALERAIQQDVALGPLYLIHGLQKLPSGNATPPAGRPPPTVKEQLAGMGLAVVDTVHGLKLMNCSDDERLAFLDVTELLARQDPYEVDELGSLLDGGFAPESPAQEHNTCFRGWLIIRTFDQRQAQLAGLVRWLQQHPEAPRAMAVRERRDSKETSEIIRRLLDSKCEEEQLYLAFVLQLAVPPEVGLEALAERAQGLEVERDLFLATRLKEVLNRWVAVLSNESLEALFSDSPSPLLRMGAMQALASRLSLRDPTGNALEVKTENMIAARKDLSPGEAAELSYNRMLWTEDA